MNHKRPPVQAIVILVVLIAFSAYFFYAQSAENKNGALTASGFIEATQVNISPELAGKAFAVAAAEGETVKKDQTVLTLDGSLLYAQRNVAAAQLESAKAALAAAQTKYDQTLQAALSAQEASRAKELRFSAPDEFDQPAWYFNQEESLAAAQAEVSAAQAALDEARANLQKAVADLNNADYLAAEKRLAEARAAFLIADKVKIQAENAGEAGGLRDAAYDYYNRTKDELNAAQKQFNALTNSKAKTDLQYARGAALVAQQRYDAAWARLLSLQTGAYSPAVVAAKDALAQAQAAVQQAQASLDLLDQQLAKLEIRAPMDGVILTRNVEPGEFLQPGAVALTMADLNDLTITVYVPENRYGQVSLGQQAEVRVDSFPDLVFSARVIQISDQAEYTPRNVQTVEGRSATFYAIKLKVDDPQGKLKIGMPADVEFK